MNATRYELLDFGAGRKLERFGDRVLDRPSPPAEPFSTSRPPADWQCADGRFRREDGLKGAWSWRHAPAPDWTLDCGRFRLLLRPTDVGHLGVFPEQAENWRWIFDQTRKALETGAELRVLNLFAYTGGSTLAAAAAMKLAGACAEDRDRVAVVHVDSARNIVAWARDNARVSGLETAPVRWIPEDALKFVQREVRRGNRYEALILDPPSYGHGTRGEVWKLDRHLPELLAACAGLTGPAPRWVLLTAHSPGLDGQALARMLRRFFPGLRDVHGGPMRLVTPQGRALPSGDAAWG